MYDSISLTDIDEYISTLIPVNVPHTWDNWDEHWAELTEDFTEVISTYGGWTEFEEECPWA